MVGSSIYDGRAADQAALFTRVTGVPCVLLDRTGKVHHPERADAYPCRLCRHISSPGGRPEHDGIRHLKWVEESIRFGGRSVFMCENAFTHWTSPIMDESRLIGALVAGPVLTIDEQGFFEDELLPRYCGVRDAAVLTSLRDLFARVPRLAPAQVTTYSELLLQLTLAVSTNPVTLRDAEDSLGQQSRMNEYIQDLKAKRADEGDDPEIPTYPIEKESMLLSHIRSGDVRSAQRTLNELLSHVFFAAGTNMGQVKIRSRELIVLLSRAVLTEGADPEEVFGLNYQFVDAIDHQNDINGIAYWMARIVRRFADLIFYLPHLGHARALRRAITSIKADFRRPLRITEVAATAGLSPSHFSRVFHEEIGQTFVSYLNRVRCEHARELLRGTDLPVQEIAHQSGFSDHSYFTKVYRSLMGATPSAHRGA
jgi:two-component system, response regulator YesN